MKDTYLEVTYRHWKPLAAYFYLPRESGDTCAQTKRAQAGLFADFAEDGRPIGIEITAPSQISADDFMALLVRLGVPPVEKAELAPLCAA
jgi:uncharacterized protein YuzE